MLAARTLCPRSSSNRVSGTAGSIAAASAGEGVCRCASGACPRTPRTTTIAAAAATAPTPAAGPAAAKRLRIAFGSRCVPRFQNVRRITVVQQSAHVFPKEQPKQGAPGASTRRPVDSRERSSAHQSFHAHRCTSGEVVALAIRQIDALDCAVAPLQVEGLRLGTAADNALHIELVRVAVGIDDGKTPHLDVIAARCQPDRTKASFPASHSDAVPVSPTETDLLTAKLNPILTPVAIAPLRGGFGDHECTHKRGQCRANDREPHLHDLV
jgi:hypothetical protein